MPRVRVKVHHYINDYHNIFTLNDTIDGRVVRTLKNWIDSTTG